MTAIGNTDPNDVSEWYNEVHVFNRLNPSEPLIGLVQGRTTLFPIAGLAKREVNTGHPDWARYSNALTFDLELHLPGSGGSGPVSSHDIYCVDLDPITYEPTSALNLTAHLDDNEGAQMADAAPSWLPGDAGIVFERDGSLAQLRFVANYAPGSGCPTAANLAATAELLATSKGKGNRGRHLQEPDYLQ